MEFDCKMESCPDFPGRKRCHKSVKHTTDPQTGHVWEEIFMPCGHIRHDQTAFYEQMNKIPIDSSKINFDTRIERDPEAIQLNTDGGQHIQKLIVDTIEFRCASRHIDCPKRKDATEVICAATVSLRNEPGYFLPWLLCKMPCGAYFNCLLAHEGPAAEGFPRPICNHAGLGTATIESLRCAISREILTRKSQES